MILIGRPSLRGIFADKDHLAFALIMIELSLVGLLISLIIFPDEAIKCMIWNGNTHGYFPDFSETLYASNNLDPYSVGSVYPPLVYLALYPISLLIPGISERATSESLILFSIFVVIIIFFFVPTFRLFWRQMEIEKRQKIIIILFLFSSAPMIYCIERGNLVFVGWLLIAAFVFLYDSEDVRKRHLSIFILALSLNIKPYLGLFALTFLLDKRYKDLALLLLYSSILFIVPMMFVGGIPEISSLVSNMLNLEAINSEDVSDFGFGYKVGLTNTIGIIVALLEANLGIIISKSTIDLTLIILKICFGTGFLYTAVKSDSWWERVLAILLIYVLLTSISWIYNAIYMSIPLILLLNEKENKGVFVCTILIVLSLVSLPYGYAITGLSGGNQVSYSSFVSSMSLVILSCVLIYLNLKKGFSKHFGTDSGELGIRKSSNEEDKYWVRRGEDGNKTRSCGFFNED